MNKFEHVRVMGGAGMCSFYWFVCKFCVYLDCFSHSITVEVWKPARSKTAKIHGNEHTSGVLVQWVPSRTSLDMLGGADAGALYRGVAGIEALYTDRQTDSQTDMTEKIGLGTFLVRFAKCVRIAATSGQMTPTQSGALVEKVQP